jgi:hypothetical protein
MRRSAPALHRAIAWVLLASLLTSACYSTKVPPIGSGETFKPEADERALWAKAEKEEQALLKKAKPYEDPLLETRTLCWRSTSDASATSSCPTTCVPPAAPASGSG